MAYKIWVDLDGVLANWHKSACVCFNVPYPENTVLSRGWIEEQTGMSVSTTIAAIDKHPGFWENIEVLPHAPQLLSYLDVNFPDWGILTSATHNPVSWAGKVEWVRRYLDVKGLHRLAICCGNKARFATSYSVLIDDNQKIIDEWREAGGIGFRWVEYSADMETSHEEQLQKLKMELNPLIEKN